MPKPINHSELIPFLRDLFAANNERLIKEILLRTRDGVVEEGGLMTVDSVLNQKPGGITRIPDGVAIESMIGVAGGVTGFKFGAKSLKELTGVNPDLVRCAGLALTKYSRVDFTVFDGIRTKAEQTNHVKNGTSKTMKSKHLDGLAVDLVPIIGGIPKWDWTGCYEIAFAMDQAATELGMADRITWGGCWDKTLDEYGGRASDYIAAVEAYKVRHPGPDFIDGPHFEIRP